MVFRSSKSNDLSEHNNKTYFSIIKSMKAKVEVVTKLAMKSTQFSAYQCMMPINSHQSNFIIGKLNRMAFNSQLLAYVMKSSNG